MQATFPNANALQDGSPVILRSNGQYAYIRGFKSPTTALLDVESDTLDAGEQQVWVFSESGGRRSPVIHVLSTRTALPN